MKMIEIKDYPNFLDHVKLNSDEVRSIIKNYPLQFSQTRIEMAEWKIAFPMFLSPFYKFIYLHNSVPNQRDFYNYYLCENIYFFESNKYKPEILEGLKARVYRTYPSLVRDLHFALFVKENLKEVGLIYNRKLDIEEGIDLLIIHKGNFFGISLYTNTTRARVVRKKKANRHIAFNNVRYIELPVEFNENEKCGSFFLYGQKELKRIMDEINKQEHPKNTD